MFQGSMLDEEGVLMGNNDRPGSRGFNVEIFWRPEV